ncbi:MAG TPA: sugar transferase [bacterium]|jgi:exopolysaccharide biosynthesis polyprenyl glycosylphosphotransferase
MKHLRLVRLWLFLTDFALLEAAFFGVYWWRFESGMFRNPVSFSPGELLAPSLFVTAYWLLLFAWFGLFRFDPLQSRRIAALAASKAAAIGVLVLFILTFQISDPLPSTRLILVSYGVAIFIIVSGDRLALLTILRAFRIRGMGAFRTLLVGDGNRARQILRHVAMHPELGFRVQAVIARLPDQAVTDSGIPWVGTLSGFRKVLRFGHYDAVLLAPDERDESSLGRLLRILREFRVRCLIFADQYNLLVGEVKPTRVYGHPLVDVRPELLSSAERTLKRITDVAFALLLLIVTLPVWVILAIAIPLDSRGAIFYAQKRVGLNGRAFTLYKFRSMAHDAESRTGAVLAAPGDPRVTRVGRLIRSTRLDELPQLINVLSGEMSLVGPRPERKEFVERFVKEIPLYERRLNVKPGLTGWSQVHLKYDSRADQISTKLQYDFFYIENMSLPLDVKILFMTLFVMLRGEGT